MAEVCLNILIKNASQPDPTLYSTTERWKKYYASKYSNRSIFSVVKELPNWTLPRTMEPTENDDNKGEIAKKLYVNHTTAALPCITKEAERKLPKNAPIDAIKEEKRKIIGQEKDDFMELRDKAIRQQDYITFVKETYHSLAGKNPSPAVKSLLNEIDRMLDPNETFVRSALTHNMVINLADPNLRQITINEITNDIQLANNGNITAWHQSSIMKEFFDQLNKLGMVAEFMTDRVESGAVIQTKDELNKLYQLWQIVSEPENTLSNSESDIAKIKHGDNTYNLYNRHDYLEFKDTIEFNKREDSIKPIDLIQYECEELIIKQQK